MVPPTGVGLTLKVTGRLKVYGQLGIALVVVTPVIINVCPLLAAVSITVVKLPVLAASATTPVMGVWSTPLIE